MIHYNVGSWGVAFVVNTEGSVFPKTLVWAVPSAVLAGILQHFLHGYIDVDGSKELWSDILLCWDFSLFSGATRHTRAFGRELL